MARKKAKPVPKPVAKPVYQEASDRAIVAAETAGDLADSAFNDLRDIDIDELATAPESVREAVRKALKALEEVSYHFQQATDAMNEAAESSPLDSEELGDAVRYGEHLADPCKCHAWAHLTTTRALERVADCLLAAKELAS